MKPYLGMFREELQRMFTIKYLGESVIFMLIILALSVTTFFQQYGFQGNTLYTVFENITIGGFFLELIYIPASFFVALNLSMDIRQKSYYLYSIRSGKGAYIIAKIVVGTIFALLVTEIALNVMLGAGAALLNIVDKEYYSGGADIYEDLLMNNQFLYFEIRVLFISLSSAFFTALGMMITAIIPNKYVAIVSAYMTSIIFQKMELILRFPESVDVSGIIGGFVRVNKSIAHSVTYIILFFVTCIAITIYGFNKIMKRRCYSEKK